MLRHSVHVRRAVGAAALLALLIGTGASSAEQGRGPARLEPLGHNDLGGPQGGGKGGEGIELMVSHGKRYLFTAAESGPNCFSVVDATDPASLQLVAQVGLQPAGLQLYDVSDPASPAELGFFDTSGPSSRGVHHVWFVDGHFAY